ncbi:MAG: putative ABC transporter permease [Coriobacteriales bacterium]|jgi:uncharacterized membrane protein|nr:putative ABC transporter permease [Coriobacteriales bacterium]
MTEHKPEGEDTLPAEPTPGGEHISSAEEAGFAKETAVLDSLENQKPKKTPLILKILAILLILATVLAVPVLVLLIIGMAIAYKEVTTDLGIATFAIAVVLAVILLASAVLGGILGVNLLRNKRRHAQRIAEFLIVATVLAIICEFMLDGASPAILSYLVRLVILIAIAVYIDPVLLQERKVQRKLRDMQTRDEAEDGTLGRDTSGKGYIKLDFFNIFWIFVLCSIIGVVIETIYYAVVVGGYEDRAGLLYGPFSPIYGFGAVLMTIALNRLYKKPLIVIFLLSALIGGSFEYVVSWFLQFAFGITAWDYSGTFLSIDGRTNGIYMFFWGVLGCVWIKFTLPYILKFVNLIPWNWRYSLTTICAVLMIANGVLTLGAYDSWYKRKAGEQASNALEEFCDVHYDDTFMQDRFQTMTIDPSKVTRT